MNTNNNNIQSNDSGKIIDKKMETVLHDSMMPYAEYVILDRAIPRLEDGLKPVQRRVLYAMYDLGNTPDKPYKKCARIVGECLGKYHPHGDSSVYEALTRMAQDFNMGGVLIDGQGNYGSADGDSPAAMRYTEARLAPLAMELLRDLDKETVPFGSNFDDTLKEPNLLPCRFPNLLVNGANGIAIGLATSIPTHNLEEVIDGTIAYITGIISKAPISFEDLLSYIPAPDFPTGGDIVPLQIEQAYRTGKGKILIRSKFKIEREGEKRNIVFTEFPYQTNKNDVIKKIYENKEKEKAGYDCINEVVDESDREGHRLVVKLTKNTNPADVIKMLYKDTDLSKSFNFNMVAIADGKPRLLSLMGIIEFYSKYQRNIVKKRSIFDLAQAKERSEILNGLMIAINNIDEVIKIIKSAKNTTEAKTTLKARFGLTEKQATAILEMRLKRLTSLEIDELKKEIAELAALIAELSAIVASENKQYEVVIKELKEIKRKYGVPRKSSISVDENEIYDKLNEANNVFNGIFITRANGSVIYVKSSGFGNSNREATAFDDKNAVVDKFEAKSDTFFYAFTDKGNYYKGYTSDLEPRRLREKGYFIKDLYKESLPDEKIIKVITVNEGQEEGITIAHFTSGGNVRYTSLVEYKNEKHSYGAAVKFKAAEEKVIAVDVTPNILTFDLIMVSSGGNVIRTEGGDIMVKAKLTLGSSLMKLNPGETAIFAGIYKSDPIVLVSKEGKYRRMLTADLPSTNKNCKGTKVLDNAIFADLLEESDTLIVTNENDELNYFPVDQMLYSMHYEMADYLSDDINFTPKKVVAHKIHN